MQWLDGTSLLGANYRGRFPSQCVFSLTIETHSIGIFFLLQGPDDYNFHGTRAIENLDKVASIPPDTPPLTVRGDFSPSQNKEGKVDVETGSIPVEESGPFEQDERDKPVDIASLRASFKRAAISSSSLTAIVTIVGSSTSLTHDLLALVYLPPTPKCPSPCSSATMSSACISLGSGFP